MKREIIGNSPVGEKFFVDNYVLQVFEGGCRNCFFDEGWKSHFNGVWMSTGCAALKQHYDTKCMSSERVDGKSVAFKLVGMVDPDGKIIPQKELPNS